MAIQLDLSQSQFGVPFNGAYFRIVLAAVSRQREGRRSVMIDIVGYATKPENDDTREVDFRRYHIDYETVEAISAENFLAKCYLWIMAQEDMNGAISI